MQLQEPFFHSNTQAKYALAQRKCFGHFGSQLFPLSHFQSLRLSCFTLLEIENLWKRVIVYSYMAL